MAEERRVEPRGIIGTGMLLDPEYIEEFFETAERTARANAPRKKGKFQKVFEEVKRATEEKENTSKKK